MTECLRGFRTARMEVSPAFLGEGRQDHALVSDIWLAPYCGSRGVALESSMLDKIVTLQSRAADSLLPADMTPAQWRAFVDDYFRVVDFAFIDHVAPAQAERRRKNVLRKYGVTLPDDIEEDDHSRNCRLCIAGLYNSWYRIAGFFEYAPLRSFLRNPAEKERIPAAAREHCPQLLRDACGDEKWRTWNATIARSAAARHRCSHHTL